MNLDRRQFINASTLALAGAVGHGSPLFGRGLVPAAQVTSRSTSEFGFRRRVDSIDWYCELRGRGPTVVLIPSGEGDCGSFDKVAASLSREFAVLTFDMPGFSRSSDPPEFASYSMSRAASEVAALVRALGVGPATFYGCSSGGRVALWLASDHSDVVRNVAVHEVAGLAQTESTNSKAGLTTASDEEIVRACKDRFRNQLNEDGKAWDALGEAFHERLERNYVTWVHRYVGRMGRPPAPDELRGRPVTWTIGALTPAGRVFGNIELAHAAGLRVTLLTCKHFPQVSIPNALADHIKKVAHG